LLLFVHSRYFVGDRPPPFLLFCDPEAEAEALLVPLLLSADALKEKDEEAFSWPS